MKRTEPEHTEPEQTESEKLEQIESIQVESIQAEPEQTEPKWTERLWNRALRETRTEAQDRQAARRRRRPSAQTQGWGKLFILSRNWRISLPVLPALAILALYGIFLPAGNRTEQTGRYVLYFPEQSLSAGTGALRAVPSALTPGPDADTRYVAVSLIQELLSGPREEGLRSAFPAGTVLRSLEVRGSRAVADFSGGYSSLSGVALTLADYSVTLTLTQLPEISLVRITVGGQELAYRDRQSFTARDVLLDPETDVVGTVDAALYFPDADGELTEERRTIPLYEGQTQVGAVTEAVEAGPESRDLLPALPEEFRVRSVWQEGELCFVNLSTALADALPEGTDLSLSLRALDMSLCSLESVREVRYLADGELVAEYGGVRLTEPYETVEAGEEAG